MTDFYKLLNITHSSSIKEVKNAYRKLALIYHPDVHGNDPEKTEKFKKINVAYENIINSFETGFQPKNAPNDFSR